MTDLSCCPFCGSQPKVTTTQVRIQCGEYTCGVRPRTESNDLDTAIARWNERVGTLQDVAPTAVVTDESIDSCSLGEIDTAINDIAGSPAISDT